MSENVLLPTITTTKPSSTIAIVDINQCENGNNMASSKYVFSNISFTVLAKFLTFNKTTVI